MDDTRLVGLLVALGAGLLIGLERERRKGQGPHRHAAGVRTFTLAATGGALAQWLSPQLVWIGAALVAALSAFSYLKSRARDPGLTTEIALFIAYLIGVSAVTAPALGAACAVGLAAVLAARSPLHRFATRVLSEAELHDALLLLGFGLVVLPLACSRRNSSRPRSCCSACACRFFSTAARVRWLPWWLVDADTHGAWCWRCLRGMSARGAPPGSACEQWAETSISRRTAGVIALYAPHILQNWNKPKKNGLALSR